MQKTLTLSLAFTLMAGTCLAAPMPNLMRGIAIASSGAAVGLSAERIFLAADTDDDVVLLQNGTPAPAGTGDDVEDSEDEDEDSDDDGDDGDDNDGGDDGGDSDGGDDGGDDAGGDDGDD